MDTKSTIATDIPLQTRIPRQCSKHRRLYLIDADPAPEFKRALELLLSQEEARAVAETDLAHAFRRARSDRWHPLIPSSDY